jgi:hypothetical protein
MINLPVPPERHDRRDQIQMRTRIEREFARVDVDHPYRVLRGSATWNPPSTADGAIASTTVTCLGARIGDPVTVGFTANVAGNELLWTGYVQAADTVRVVFLNKQGAAVDLASGTITVMVFQLR